MRRQAPVTLTFDFEFECIDEDIENGNWFKIAYDDAYNILRKNMTCDPHDFFTGIDIQGYNIKNLD